LGWWLENTWLSKMAAAVAAEEAKKLNGGYHSGVSALNTSAAAYQPIAKKKAARLKWLNLQYRPGGVSFNNVM